MIEPIGNLFIELQHRQRFGKLGILFQRNAVFPRHVDNFLVDDASWDIRYFLVDTRNWWLGQHVLLAPYAVREITWPDQRIWLNVDRGQVKASPPWDPFKMIDEAYAHGLHRHYGWPGYRY